MVCDSCYKFVTFEDFCSLNPCSIGIWSVTKWFYISQLTYCLVLILVLLEYGLWRKWTTFTWTSWDVLILVLLEYGLWPRKLYQRCRQPLCLNPCSIGIWSVTSYYENNKKFLLGLNPCSIGIWSVTKRTIVINLVNDPVLILVLLEYGLWRDWGRGNIWRNRLS